MISDDSTRGTPFHRRSQSERRSWPWWILAIGALLAGLTPALIMGLKP